MALVVPSQNWNRFIDSIAALNQLEVVRKIEQAGAPRLLHGFAMFAVPLEQPVLVGNVPPNFVQSMMEFHLIHQHIADLRVDHVAGEN